ncbi:hypothetical protein, partial [Umezawaea endophytica]
PPLPDPICSSSRYRLATTCSVSTMRSPRVTLVASYPVEQAALQASAGTFPAIRRAGGGLEGRVEFGLSGPVTVWRGGLEVVPGEALTSPGGTALCVGWNSTVPGDQE